MLHGRERERAQVRQLVDDAMAGTGGCLVVLGEPGVGKSTLLEDAARAAQADGLMTVLRTQGLESEAPLPFAALQRLLRPLMPLAGRLPDPQHHALRVVFGEALADDTQRYLVFLATLSLLAEASSSKPVLAVVDDAHWLDDASGAALQFVARRLQQEAVAVLFGARTGDVRSFDSQGLPTLPMTGLDLASTTDLLRSETGLDVSPEVAALLLASTGGNPLALSELPSLLSTEQLTGHSPLPERLPVNETVERTFLDRARRLSPAAQRLLLVAAADDSTSIGTISAAAAHWGAGSDALTEVELSGLVRVEGRQLHLRHPLVRSAVYSGATSIDRRAAHDALATVLTRAEDSDRRAWHLASSVDEPDADVVAELESAAVRAEQRGGYEAASAAWHRAAELSDDSEGRARRLYGAARGAWLSGHPARAVPLAEAARDACTDPGLRSDIIRLRARIEWNTGSVPRAHRMLLEAVRDVAPHDPDRAREMAMFGAALAAFGGASDVHIDPRDYADIIAPDPTSRQRCFSELIIGLSQLRQAEWADAGRLLRQAFTTAERLGIDDQDLVPNLGIGALQIGDAALAATYHERLLTRARNTGAMVMVLYAMTRLGFSDVATGQWSSAAARQSEAAEMAESTGQPVLQACPLAWLALLAALRGEPTYAAQLDQVQELVREQSVGILDVVVRDLLRWAQGVNASPRTAAGFHHLAQISHHIVQRQAGIDRVESAVHSDQHETALLWITDLETFGAATDQPWAQAIAEHGRAVLASLSGQDGADSHFESALRWHDGPAGRPFDRARTHLAYGEHLRRTRRRVAAREHLKAALQTFEDLKAEPWVERVSQELRASGETTRKRDAADTGVLTPSELQVAKLVQEGMSNREVAAQLFVSPRTVDFHLRNVFAKTGVSSRMELARLTLT